MSKILVFGGTHGNEWTGTYLVTNYHQDLQSKYPALKLKFIHANPKAFEMNKRFVDEDLNRVFDPIKKKLAHKTYEYQRGLEIQRMLQDEAPEWIFDLHTTTANLGPTVIITQDSDDNFKLAAALVKKMPKVKIIFSPDPTQKYLLSQSQKGLMIEVGPIAGGIIKGSVLLETKQILELLFELIETKTYLKQTEVTYFEEIKDIFYPLKDDQIDAFIHPSLQDKDFSLLQKGDPLFQHFDGQTSYYDQEDQSFPIFINEAAYYPSKLAFTLCKKSNKSL